MTHTVTEFGHRTDCKKNGCNPPHADNGRVHPWLQSFGEFRHDLEINGHAMTAVARTVTYSDWESFPDLHGKQRPAS